MTSAENIHPDMVIRARVKLLGVERLPHHERVAAYRLLSRVDPHYLRRLAQYLIVWAADGAPTPALRAGLLAEATTIATGLPASDPDRARLLLAVHQAQAKTIGTAS